MNFLCKVSECTNDHDFMIHKVHTVQNSNQLTEIITVRICTEESRKHSKECRPLQILPISGRHLQAMASHYLHEGVYEMLELV